MQSDAAVKCARITAGALLWRSVAFMQSHRVACSKGDPDAAGHDQKKKKNDLLHLLLFFYLFILGKSWMLLGRIQVSSCTKLTARHSLCTTSIRSLECMLSLGQVLERTAFAFTADKVILLWQIEVSGDSHRPVLHSYTGKLFLGKRSGCPLQV